MLVSVIIPIYNVEKYIQVCLESVKNQSYKNIQVILVNDGSTDSSEKIAQVFVDNDPRFKILHQKNAGLSAARNTGIKEAKGDYIFYLDSDDYLKPECLETLVTVALAQKADVVQSNFYYDYPDHLLYNSKFKEQLVAYSREEALLKLVEQHEIKNFAWGKLIRADIAKRILFPEGKYFEDTVWMYQVIQSSEKYVTVGKPMLYYLQRGESISGSFSIRNLDQLELNAERLMQIQNQNSLKLYEKALKTFNDLIFQHQSIINSKSTQLDRNAYQTTLNNYIAQFKLGNRFALQHIVAKSLLLHKLNSIYKRVENRFFKRSYWITIQKENIIN